MISKIKNAFFKEEVINYENILDNPHHKIGSFLSRFITLLVFLFIAALTFESLGENDLLYQTELFIFDAFVSSVFALEYIYRLYKVHNKLNFVFNPMRIIDLLSFVPFFLGLVAVGDFLKILRIFRVLRVLRLVKKIPLTAGFIKALKDYSDEYKAVFLLFGVILFVGSSFVYFVEREVVGTSFTSIPMTLWWGLVTMTTVGYGDMYPLTDIGRFLASFLVFLGPIVIGLFSAVTIMVFQETSRHQDTTRHFSRGKLCSKCKTKNSKEANYCMKCGESLV